VKFSVTKESSATNWGFDYLVSGGTVHSSSTNPQSTTIDGISVNSIVLTFYITNTPGTQQNIIFSISNVVGGNCSETYFDDNSATHTIKAMPAIGSFE
jgi:hypothetical protein